MGQNNNFFEKKKGWSLVKDQIVNSYLTPYVTKLLTAKRPLYIIDCFAGKGKFGDGQVGSPIIIGEQIKRQLEKNANAKLSAIFIEKKYTNDLIENMKGYQNYQIYKGSFEDNLHQILCINSNSSLFFYIDPYGIKSLDFNRFVAIKKKQYKSVEMLLNFNSFGFLREACRLLKYSYNQIEGMEQDDNYEVDEANSIPNMNMIANGEYWIDILERYHNKEITMYEAEERFVSKYICKLKDLFKYVVNIPIKSRLNNIPKYRLIFGTNYYDGLQIMVDNMNQKWKMMLEEERGGQQVLFEYDFPDMSQIKGFNIENDLLHASHKPILLQDLLVKIIEKYGISYSTQEYREILKALEKRQLISVERDPKLTPTRKLSTSWDPSKYKIRIQRTLTYDFIIE